MDLDTTSGDSAKYKQHSAECAKWRRRKIGRSAGIDSAKKRQRLERGGVFNMGRCVLVTGRICGSYREQRDGFVRRNILW